MAKTRLSQTVCSKCPFMGGCDRLFDKGFLFIVFQGALLGTVLFYVGSVGVFMHRWHTFPIAQRLPFLVVSGIVGGAIAGVSVLLVAAFPQDQLITNCSLYLNLLIIGEYILILSGVTRFMWLVLKDFATKDLVTRRSLGSNNEPLANRDANSIDHDFQRPNELGICCWLSFANFIIRMMLTCLTIRQTIAVFLSPYALFGIIELAIIWSDPRAPATTVFGSEDCHEALFMKVAAVNTAMIGYLMFMTMLIIVPLMRLKDNFGLYLEIRLMLLVVTFLIFLVVAVLDKSLMAEFFVKTHVWQLIIGAVLIPLFVAIETLYPIHLSFVHEKKFARKHKNRARAMSMSSTGAIRPGNATFELRLLLSNPQARSLFQQFLESEFSVENLFFVDACDALRRTFQTPDHDKGMILASLAAIQDTFLSASASSSVNISHRTRKEVLDNIRSAIENPDQFDPRILDAAFEEVFAMMSKDSFSRFKLNGAYQSISVAISGTWTHLSGTLNSSPRNSNATTDVL
eukprot:TRINITY_DN18474_c0_g1_i2.p1 TRINITY_DN18474_c0_g1~~TRINITY_DN18474_c0_g1_i2.p1  ORF type:complete len:515 (-),score=127.81 TRINITY_DN18474_c0_g1_i2:58-1602(-)